MNSRRFGRPSLEWYGIYGSSNRLSKWCYRMRSILTLPQQKNLPRYYVVLVLSSQSRAEVLDYCVRIKCDNDSRIERPGSSRADFVVALGDSLCFQLRVDKKSAHQGGRPISIAPFEFFFSLYEIIGENPAIRVSRTLHVDAYPHPFYVLFVVDVFGAR